MVANMLYSINTCSATLRWLEKRVKLTSNVPSTILLHRDGATCVEMFELECPLESCGHVMHYDGVKDGYFVKNNYLVADLKSALVLRSVAFFLDLIERPALSQCSTM
jgi:hypothetical protein